MTEVVTYLFFLGWISIAIAAVLSDPFDLTERRQVIADRYGYGGLVLVVASAICYIFIIFGGW